MPSGTTIARVRRLTSVSQILEKLLPKVYETVLLSESSDLFCVLRAYGAKHNFPATG